MLLRQKRKLLIGILLLAFSIGVLFTRMEVCTSHRNGAGRSEVSIGHAPKMEHSFLSYLVTREVLPNISIPNQSLLSGLPHSTSSNRKQSSLPLNHIESVNNRPTDRNHDTNLTALDTLPQDVINSVQRFVYFVGYPRSGHSIIGSMMDAHPNVVIAHELFLFRSWWSKMENEQRSFTKSLIFRSIYESSLSDAHKGWRNEKNTSKGYSLDLAYPWQGRYNGSIQVIGDKSGGDTAFTYMKSPRQFRERYKVFTDAVGIPVRVIHVVRNPFDIISTTVLYETGKKMYPDQGKVVMSEFVRRHKIYMEQVKNKTSDVHVIKKAKLDEPFLLNFSINKFFKMAKGVKDIIELVGPENVIELHNYELVMDPAGTMLKICGFLGLSCSKDYLDACVSKTFKTLSVSREYVLWRDTKKLLVESLKEDYPFFQRYSFDSKV